MNSFKRVAESNILATIQSADSPPTHQELLRKTVVFGKKSAIRNLEILWKSTGLDATLAFRWILRSEIGTVIAFESLEFWLIVQMAGCIAGFEL